MSKIFHILLLIAFTFEKEGNICSEDVCEAGCCKIDDSLEEGNMICNFFEAKKERCEEDK